MSVSRAAAGFSIIAHNMRSQVEFPISELGQREALRRPLDRVWDGESVALAEAEQRLCRELDREEAAHAGRRDAAEDAELVFNALHVHLGELEVEVVGRLAVAAKRPPLALYLLTVRERREREVWRKRREREVRRERCGEVGVRER